MFTNHSHSKAARKLAPALALAALLGLAAAGASAKPRGNDDAGNGNDRQAAPAGQTGSITGTVLDEDGKPAANVRVGLLNPPQRRDREGSGDNGGPGGDKPQQQQGAGERGNRRGGDRSVGPGADRPLGLRAGEDGGDRGGKGQQEQRPGGGGDDGERRPPRPKPVAETTTDAKGRFTFEDVPAGRYVVVAGIREERLIAHERVEVTAGKTAAVDLTLEQAKFGRGGPGGEGGGQGKQDGGNKGGGEQRRGPGGGEGRKHRGPPPEEQN